MLRPVTAFIAACILFTLPISGAWSQQAPKAGEAAPRPPSPPVPGPNAIPGMPDGEKSKRADFNAAEQMPAASRYQAAAVGLKLHNAAGDVIGTVENLIVSTDGRILAAVVDIDRLLGLTQDRITIEWNSLRLDHRDNDAAFVTSLSSDELRARPKYDGPARSGG